MHSVKFRLALKSLYSSKEKEKMISILKIFGSN